ncbi:urease accessory protein UreH [Synechococcus sp. PCC 7502]|uniref:urease accessory protein UreD n=1 Tax=Synechococcus sp. PCC 7502 TaxID=1173263 RepID=UPI00029FB3E8|nr:urease accessory protein UreD [Synechococcus sp. PCC 7502]AFY74673.1 urease accessory protein UreH [Synechococcus sp. PCC 7502]
MGSSSWQGNLRLNYGYHDGITQVIKNISQAPLRVQKSFYPEQKDICHTAILHTAGGIVGGDRLDVMINLGEKSQSLITTATASKIYGAKTDPNIKQKSINAQQTIHSHLQSDSYLEWLPQETIVFDGAIYHQKHHIELEQNALWLGWEIVRFGRSARGERFLSGSWRSHTEVWRAGIPLWIDRQWLQGGEAMINSLHGLDRCSVVGTLALVGKTVNQDLLQNIHILSSSYSGQLAVTGLVEGLICRYRGHSTSEVRTWFIAVWELLRLFYIHRPTCIPRIWLV